MRQKMNSATGRVGAYRPDIDGLRAVAVGSVVAFHAFPNLVKGGFVGVDIFFVISGFLISGIIFGALEADGFSYANFYGRRIRRIFPALIAVCAATLLAGWYVLLPDEFEHLGKHLAAGAAFVSNGALWYESGYFDAASDTKPLLHLWSLAIEEQFYIVWPLVLGLVWRRKRGFLVVTLSIALVSFVINVATVGHDPVAAFYSPLSRFWELMLGGVLAYIAMHRPEVLQRHGTARSWAGAALVGAGIFVLTKERAFPGYWALLPTVGACLLISAEPDAWFNRRILSARPMVWIGLISYPLYLWHWPILVFAKIVKGKVLTPVDRLEAVAASVVLAYLTYRLLERRLRHAAGTRVPQGLAAVMAGIAATGLVILPGLVPSRLKTEHVEQILAASYDWEYPPVAAHGGSFGALRSFTLPNRPGAFTVFLGDSNMEMYGPRMDRVIKEHPGTSNGAILVGNQRECALLREILVGGQACPQAVDKVRALIADASTSAVAIVASWGNYRKELAEPANQDRLAEFMRSAGQNKRAYLILNIPSGDELAPTSMFTGSRLAQISPKPVAAMRFDMDGFKHRFDDIDRALHRVAELSGATVIDPVERLCPGGQCPLFDAAGTPLYLDAGHLTRTYAARAATYIDVTLAPASPAGEPR
jgi:peptidoglycan/LPS O-acetylase OafA/YrhL